MSLYGKILQWQTRLVLLQPAISDTARLELSLVVVDLVESSVGVAVNHERIVTYDALSYTWGTADPSVECVCNGKVILLRENLASALRYLRRLHYARYVWVDFLCINQQDEPEKDIQIPHMQAIYSKASNVVIWLGDSLVIDDIMKKCNEQCGTGTDTLICANHKEPLWVQIMEFSWFQRTWVRQEVYAAKKLYVCTRHFTKSWEQFTRVLEALKPLHFFFNQKNLQNQRSLNESYNALRNFERLHPTVRLMNLLKQGTGFQATQPHDHVYSILGMVTISKDGTSLIPVIYGKSYEELCGDVTRLIIRETGSIDILKLCMLQHDPTYAFDWPKVSWSLNGRREVRIDDLLQSRGQTYTLYRGDHYPSLTIELNNDWFGQENPIRAAQDIKVLENEIFFSPRSFSITSRYLVLYGKVWGTLSLMAPETLASGRGPVPTYLAEDASEVAIQKAAVQVVSGRNAPFLIYKRGLIRQRAAQFPSGFLELECESMVRWECYGKPREGDVFVSLEPGLRNVLLRKTLGNAFNVVGWGRSLETGEKILVNRFHRVKDETLYSVATVWPEIVKDKTSNWVDSWSAGRAVWNIDTCGPPGQRTQFNIR